METSKVVVRRWRDSANRDSGRRECHGAYQRARVALYPQRGSRKDEPGCDLRGESLVVQRFDDADGACNHSGGSARACSGGRELEHNAVGTAGKYAEELSHPAATRQTLAECMALIYRPASCHERAQQGSDRRRVMSRPLARPAWYRYRNTRRSRPGRRLRTRLERRW